jgi:hypothetical protein
MTAPAFVHFTTLASEILWGGFELGFSEDGCQLTYQPRYDEIFSDDMGGRAGVPSDAQFVGAIGNIDLVLTKYDVDRCDQLSSFDARKLTTPAVGVMPPMGSFVRQDGLYAALMLRAPNETLSFATAFLRRNYEINSGTKYRRYICGFELWLNQTDLTQLTSAQNRRLFTMS